MLDDGCNLNAANAGCTSEEVAYSMGQIHILDHASSGQLTSPNGYHAE